MPPFDTGPSINPSQLRSFETPPTDLRKTIQTVAEHVAQHGPTAEFQLRSRDKDGQYSFLMLDNQYAPFYQYQLAEARTRIRNVVGNTDKVEQESSRVVAGKKVVETPSIADTEYSSLTYNDGLREIYEYTYGQSLGDSLSPMEPNTAQEELDILEQTRQDRSSQIEDNDQHNVNNLIPASNQLSSYQASVSEDAQTQSQATDSNSLPTNPSPDLLDPLQTITPFGVQQEVHLLDSSGSDDSGLCTYVIINSHNDTEEFLEKSLDAYYNHSPETFQKRQQELEDRMGQEPFYRLRPKDSIVYRAPHHRLLPVGLALGEEVKMIEKNAIGIVVGRPVKMGQRTYDVADQLGIIHHNIVESDLELHKGGTFKFRLPQRL